MSDLKAEAWANLAQAARIFAADKNQAQMLSDAAKQWAVASKPAPAPRTPSGFVFGFGRNKGKAPSEVSTRDLEWYAQAYRTSIDDPAKERWKEQNAAALEAVQDELATR